MNKRNVSLIVAVAVMANGCAALDQRDLQRDADNMRDRIATQRQVHTSQQSLPLVEKKKGSYVSARTVPLAYSATLPSIFRDNKVTLNFPARTNVRGKVNLATVAARITEATKLPVRVKPDVYLSMQSLMSKEARSGQDTPSEQVGDPKNPPVVGSAAPLPTPLNRNGASAISTTLTADYDQSLPMEFHGNLADYLDFISARLGINWEYKDGGITLFRLMTKTLVVKVTPGEHKYRSSLQKGGTGQVESGTGGTNAGAGGFQADTSSSAEANFNLWKSMEGALSGMKSGVGSYTIDQAAGLVIVTDTRDVVETMASYVDVINATLTRQIDLEIRTLTVSTTDTDAASFNANLLYRKLSAGGVAEWGIDLTAPGSLVESATSGGLAVGVLRPDSRFNGSTLVAQALREMGTIVSDSTRSAITTNRVPVPIARFTTEGYLASTTPGTTSSTTGGASLPGLTPGSLTTGSFVNVLPSAYENGSVILRLSFDDTVSKGFGVITSGTGPTFQQIQTPTFTGSKSDHSVGLKDGESLVLMANSSERTAGDSRFGLSGISGTKARTRDTEIIIVTPRVRAGI